MPFDAVSMCLGFHEVFTCLFFRPPAFFFLESQKNQWEAKDDELMQVLKEHGISEQAAK